jgi:hypothetical protein
MEVLNSYGVQESGMLTSGNMFFVDSGATQASDVNDGVHGTSWDTPFATIDFAIGVCTASNGDIIYVAAGHTESVTAASGIDVDCAGITIKGMGEGDLRPLITIGATGVAGADVDLAAANCILDNLRFTIAAVDVTSMIDVDADGCTIRNCELTMNVTSYEAVDGITLASANVADKTTIENCTLLAVVAAGSNGGIVIDDAQDRLVIRKCRIIGDFADACIWSDAVNTNLLIENCYLQNDQTGDMALELTGASTGMLIRNCYSVDTDAATVDPGSCFSYECYGCDTVDTSGFLLPAAGSAT